VLADERFKHIKDQLPKWVTNNQQITQKYIPKFTTNLESFLGKEVHKEADMRRAPKIVYEEKKEDEEMEVLTEDIAQCMS
jgi:hypothetical protein